MDTPTATAATTSRDGKFLHFLKELPAWCVIGLFVGAFLSVWNISHDDFIPRIIDGLIGALLTSIIAQKPRATTSIATDVVKTDALNTDTIEQPTINVVEKDNERTDI